MNELLLRSRQRARPVNLPLLRRIARVLLQELLALERYELGVRLVGSAEMIRLNKQFLNHEGSTDVITFDYLSPAPRAPRPATRIEGEILICVHDAVAQAPRFHSTWQSELVRYLVHGVLHLLGYEDSNPAARRLMKGEENRLLRALARSFHFQQLAASEPSASGESRINSNSSPVVNRKS